MSLLLPEAGLLFWMLLAFGVVFFVLYKYGFPVITSMIDERKKFIDEALDNAKLANARLAGIEEQGRLILEKANDEQVKILREAVAARDKIIKEAQEKAESEGARMLAEAREQIRQEKEDALREIRAQVAELSIAIAEMVIRKELSDDKAHDAYMDSLLDEAFVDIKDRK
jgi:F-type H+-transporting ATPase subunit b